jgi:carbon storage regulator
VLVLRRHRDEVITIGKDVRITIVDIRGDRVRIGIDAPKSTPVHRQEIAEAIAREQEKSPQTDVARGDEQAAG